MVILVTVPFGLVIAGLFYLLSEPDSPALSHISVLISACGLLLIYIGIWRAWFSNRDWKYRTHDDKTEWNQYFDRRNKKPAKWETPNQKEGMFYEIDLREPKKVVGFHFSCGETSKAPVKTWITLRGKDGGSIYPCGNGVPHIVRETKNNESSIGMRLKKPLKAQYIRIEIKEPEIYGQQITWRVEAVYVWIKTLFGFEYTIGKCWLDKL